MAYKVYIPQPIAPAGEEYLLKKGCEIFRGSGRTDKESMIADIADCDAMIQRMAKVNREILEAGKKLKIVARHGAGYDNLDCRTARDLGIVTTYSPDTTAASVAEYTIAVLLSLAKKLNRSEQALRSGDFAAKFSDKGADVAGKTLGVIGFGRIGRAAAKKAAFGLDMKILTFLPRPEGKEIPEYVETADWDQVFERSDYISVHVPGTAENMNLIGRREFEKMKKTACLIQVSRGGVMDEAAFAEAVKTGQIAGGVVDVFAQEPPDPAGELFGIDNVILTPHIGSNTNECMDRIALDVAEDVYQVLSGGKPAHPIPV